MAGKLKFWRLQPLVKQGLATHHARIVTVGLLAGLFYLPTFSGILIQDALGGGAAAVLNAGFLYLGVSSLWQFRDELSRTVVMRDDRFIGHSLIIGGSFWLPFCGESASLQALIWMLIVVGIGWSSFTPVVFGRFPLAWSMILVGLYPDLPFFADSLISAVTGPNFFENGMAWIGAMALQLVGQSPSVQGNIISLPTGAVEVAAGCTGFDMAVVLAGTSLILGLFLKKSWHTISLAVLSGIAIAFTLNVPRIMLLAFAAVYWGEKSFDFWHGLWGGQIFACLMFTTYYYAVMAIYRISTGRKKPI